MAHVRKYYYVVDTYIINWVRSGDGSRVDGEAKQSLSYRHDQEQRTNVECLNISVIAFRALRRPQLSTNS